ncbi:hypothetical protein [Pararcticibacter amylolyticus]|uniref:hypothetical protein n=1 Tax=Pararcticibacter amylolyticus TaxID=2173175 RepID=UPI0011B2189B|nr:hypothetical protein [Pararcticibacter amylolyticus]
MKRTVNISSSVFHQALALLLTFVFILNVSVQAFHHHSSDAEFKSLGDKEQVGNAGKCAVCDYIVHKQSKHTVLSYPPVMTSPVTKPVTLLNRVYAGVYKFTLQGFTNKGPPPSSC